MSPKLPTLLVLSLAIGCKHPTPPDGGIPAMTGDSLPHEEGDKPDVEYLREADERLVSALQACLMDHARSGRWRHETWQPGEEGTSLRQSWCRPPKGRDDCPVHRTQTPDNEWIEFGLDVHPVTGKAVRVKLDMGSQPREGWGTLLVWTRRLPPPDDMERDPVFFYMDFRQWVGGRLVEQTRLGTQQNYFVTSDVSVLTESRDTARGELARLIGSPDTFRSAAMYRWYELKKRIETGLRNDTITKCDPIPGAPRADSDWATCEPRRRLTEGEKYEVKRRFAADFEKETSPFTGSYRELYAELMALMPSSACWRLLIE